MSKFKVGDKVKRVGENHKDVEQGGVYNVTCLSVINTLELEGLEGYYYDADLFELAIPFTINAGDYIDRYEFTREECERFCELAVECGFGRGDWMSFYNKNGLTCLSVNDLGVLYWFRGNACCEVREPNNITTQFREFLDKEKSMKEFTKYDLKDGMRVINREGNERVIVSGKLYKEGYDELSYQGSLDSDYGSDLTDNVASCFDIIRVTDRDGTVLFERKPEPKEMTVAEIEKALGYSVKVVK